MQISESSFRGYLPPPRSLWSVPMGQRVHQARGLYAAPKRIEKEAVRIDMVTKTIPNLSTAPSVEMILDMFMPIMAINIGTLTAMLLKDRGIWM